MKERLVTESAIISVRISTLLPGGQVPNNCGNRYLMLNSAYYYDTDKNHGLQLKSER